MEKIENPSGLADRAIDMLINPDSIEEREQGIRAVRRLGDTLDCFQHVASRDAYLVVVRLLGDDLPQRLFFNREDAEAFACTFGVEHPVSTFGADIIGCRYVDEPAVGILVFRNGKPAEFEPIERDDIPDRVSGQLTEEPVAG